MVFKMAWTPAVMPAGTSPALNRGTISFRMICADRASVSTPSSPYPTSMRIFRSLIATRSRAPLSVPLTPNFQVVATRWEKSNSGSPSNEGTMSTATWLDVFASCVCRSAESWTATADGRTRARSTTRPLSGGTSSASAGRPATTMSHSHPTRTTAPTRPISRISCSRPRTSLTLEFHFRRLGHGLFIRHREIGLLFHVQEKLGGQIRGEGADHLVELRHPVDITLTRHRDAILSAFELALEITEVLIGLQIGIVLRDGQQPSQGAGETLLRFLEFLEQGLIPQHLRGHLDARSLRPGLDHTLQRLFLVGCVSLHRIHQVRNQIGPSLILVDHFAPSGLGILIETLQVVVAAPGQGQHAGKQQNRTDRPCD